MKVKALKKRAEKAWERRRIYDRMLRDVYDFVLPMRDVSGLYAGDGAARQTEGAARTDKVFDGTAVRAAFRFAGRLQTELTPIFQNFFSLEAGPLLPNDDSRKQLTTEFQRIGGIVNGVLNSGDFHNASHEAYLDLYAGTAAMLVLEGDEVDLVRTIVVPMPEIALEEGPYGKIWGIYWKRCWKAEYLPTLWPAAFGQGGKASVELRRLVNDAPETDVEVCQYTYFDAAAKDWKLKVWTKQCANDAGPLHEETFRINPWLTPRFFKVPGEPYGRGPAQIAMPFIKTLNKAQELALHAAMFALSGIWMYRKDNVFNPDTATFTPRAMWPVSSTGGPMGAAIQRLEVPKDFDISTFIINDQREQVKMCSMDDGLPPETAAVRSATEVAERISRMSQDLAGVYGRLTLEIVVPLVQRVIDILERRGVLDTNIKIDQLLTQVRVVAPIAVGQMSSKIKAHVDAVQMALMLGGPRSAQVSFKIEELQVEIARWMGMDERFINSQAERKQMLDADAKAQKAMQAAEVMKGLPVPQNGAAQAVNGAGAM